VYDIEGYIELFIAGNRTPRSECRDERLVVLWVRGITCADACRTDADAPSPQRKQAPHKPAGQFDMDI